MFKSCFNHVLDFLAGPGTSWQVPTMRRVGAIVPSYELLPVRSGRNRHVWVGVLEVLPRYYSARQQLCASLFSVSIAICAQAFRRRSAVEEKRGPGAAVCRGCRRLQRR